MRLVGREPHYPPKLRRLLQPQVRARGLEIARLNDFQKICDICKVIEFHLVTSMTV